jgi:hypothetical protein
MECFDSVSRELAYFYIPGPLSLSTEEPDGAVAGEESADEKGEMWQIQHELLP